MKIGELAARTGTTRRQLRFYEDRGLFHATRSENNYRDYDELVVERVRQIRELLSCGLSTRLIQAILPCLDAPDSPIRFAGATDQTVAMLELECARLTERIEVMTHSRNAVATYLADLRDIRYPVTAAMVDSNDP